MHHGKLAGTPPGLCPGVRVRNCRHRTRQRDLHVIQDHSAGAVKVLAVVLVVLGKQVAQNSALDVDGEGRLQHCTHATLIYATCYAWQSGEAGTAAEHDYGGGVSKAT